MSGPFTDLVSEVTTDLLEKDDFSIHRMQGIVMTELQRGGLERYGFGLAFQLQQAQNEATILAKRILKSGCGNDTATSFPNAPPELLTKLRRLPRAIALGDGRDAKWVDSMKATYQQWELNAELKAKKAQQTIKRADDSMEIAHYLRKYGMKNLSEGFFT